MIDVIVILTALTVMIWLMELDKQDEGEKKE